MGTRFTDEETETAIDIISSVIADAKSDAPLPSPEEEAEWESLAESGDKEAFKKVMTAKLRLVYPTIPEPPYHSSWGMLWESIISGRYEGILAVKSLNYQKAYQEYSVPLKLGSYPERWISYALKNELGRAFADGWKPGRI
ncbi:MAG: hypothetical protein K5637_06435 [Lachnospiraceae bacterium]|nr:hypothetical protein [Lachnospiraceae bacterium]